MIQLYIPTIGDSLTLAEDWTFRLYREYRNRKFGEARFPNFNHPLRKNPVPYLMLEEVTDMAKKNYNFNAFIPNYLKDWDDFKLRTKMSLEQWQEHCLSCYTRNRKQYLEALEQAGISPNSLDFEEMTLPKGTVLFVDRIYIRQQKEKYDSITFNVGEKGCSFKTQNRFWVKLKDANRIKFEPKESEEDE